MPVFSETGRNFNKNIVDRLLQFSNKSSALFSVEDLKLKQLKEAAKFVIIAAKTSWVCLWLTRDSN